jgi:hypothetical protein
LHGQSAHREELAQSLTMRANTTGFRIRPPEGRDNPNFDAEIGRRHLARCDFRHTLLLDHLFKKRSA